MKETKTHLKIEYSDNEKANILEAQRIQEKDDKTLKKQKETFDDKIKKLLEKYE